MESISTGQPGTPRALILLASRPESVELLVRRLRPEVLGLIVSQGIIEPVVLKCAELNGQGVRFLYRLVNSPMEISESFQSFESVLSELEGLGYGYQEVLLDATGGTTPMRLGAALAAMTRGIGMIHQRVPQLYVDGRWELDESREVEIAPMKNPLVATGLLREAQAVELFNRRNYGAAALVFEDIVKKVSGVERGHYYRGLLLLSEGYAAWDVADYGAALEKLKEARKEMAVGFSEAALIERAGSLSDRVSLHLPFLGKLRGKLSVENVVDMLENARRRICDQGRYDDGVARLYRCVEMWHQWRLQNSHSVLASGVNWEKVGEKNRERFLEAISGRELPADLDLTRARTLDRILSGESLEEDAVFRDLLRQRNQSILAHGLEPIGQQSAERFLEYVDLMVGETEVRVGAEHALLRSL